MGRVEVQLFVFDALEVLRKLSGFFALLLLFKLVNRVFFDEFPREDCVLCSVLHGVLCFELFQGYLLLWLVLRLSFFDFLTVEDVLLLQGTEEKVLDFAFSEVGVPVSDQLRRKEVGLIDQQHKLFLSVADVLNVLVQVGSVEKEGVSRVHDLNQHIRFLDDAPKLSPNFDILLEWCNGEIYSVLFLTCEVSSPLEESNVFLMSDLLGCHGLVPGRPAGNTQVLVATTTLDVFKGLGRLDEVIDESRWI